MQRWVRWAVVAAMAVVVLLAPTAPAAGRPSSRPDGGGVVEAPPVGWIELRDGRAVGWVARSPGSARAHVEVLVDGRVVRRIRPTIDRPDVSAALGDDLVVAGFDTRLRTGAAPTCIDVVTARARVGLRCDGRDDAAFLTAPAGRGVAGTGDRLIRYSVEVEARTGLLPADVATVVDRVLGDPRSWIAEGTMRFRRVHRDDAALRILVASPGTVDRLCAPFVTGGHLSCRQGNRVIMNVDRWNGAVAFWTAPLAEYRAYLVNHEVGHYLGHGHVFCPGPGRPAPVMQQQTKGLQGCEPNGWPYP